MARKWNPSFHPRDKRGRFTKSATRVMTQGDRSRGRKALEGFKPVGFSDHAEGSAYLKKVGKPATSHTVTGYFAGDWREINADLRSGQAVPGVDEIDKAMQPLPDDLMLRRQLPADLFAHIPMDELVGMKVRDAAYSSTSLEIPSGDAPSGVTMHIAAPKGTPAIVNAADGEILLARDTEIAISRVEPNGRGGWDVYGTVLPKAKRRGTAAPVGDPASSEPSPAADPKRSTGGSRPALAPRKAPPPPATPASTVPLNDRIPSAIGDILARDGSHRGELVSLARLRDELSDLDRGDVDAALLQLNRARVIQLEPDPNRQALNQRAKDAAIWVGGEFMHLVALVQPIDAETGSD